LSQQHYIAVDLGASSGRVMVGSVDEQCIALKEMHRFPNNPVRLGESLHWDILRLWDDIQTGIAKATAAYPIAGIAVDTWGVDFGLLADDGTLLENPHCYRDTRTDGLPEKVFAKLPRDKVFSITGIQTMTLNTVFQLAALSAGNAASLRHAKTLLFTPDLIAYWLTGEKRNEYTIASTTQMLDARSRKWSPEMLQAIGVRPEIFPPMIFPGTADSIIGKVRSAVGGPLNATGIPVIAVGSHDTASAVAAVPAQGDDWLYLSSGTWSLLGALVDQPVLTARASEHNVTNEGGVGGKIRLLKNIAGMWLLEECKRAWAKAGQDYDHPALMRLAREAPAKVAMLDPDDPPFFTPGDMPAKIEAYCKRTGQRSPATVGEFTRVILESLAARYAQVRDILEEITGKKFRRLHIVGGGSQNDVLNQFAADATGLTVHAGPVEATALGNIAMQALTLGQLKSQQEAGELIARSAELKTYEPKRS
jgi:rhamnulokinase